MNIYELDLLVTNKYMWTVTTTEMTIVYTEEKNYLDIWKGAQYNYIKFAMIYKMITIPNKHLKTYRLRWIQVLIG